MQRILVNELNWLGDVVMSLPALHALRGQAPRKLVCAVPVAPPDTVERVARYADETICLETPPEFYAVGQFYRRFGQVEDDEVIACLQAYRRRAEVKSAPPAGGEGPKQ